MCRLGLFLEELLLQLEQFDEFLRQQRIRRGQEALREFLIHQARLQLGGFLFIYRHAKNKTWTALLCLVCFAMSFIALLCIALQCFAVRCNVLNCCALLCFALLCIDLQREEAGAGTCYGVLGALHCFALLCIGFQYVALHCFALL